MTARWTYQHDPYRTLLQTRVVRTGEVEGRPYVVLEDTLFYPEGGGQPSDRGTLNGVAVLDVIKRDGEILHVLADPLAEGPVEARLDWDRRWDHMQQHTGQHLLTALAQDRFGWVTTAFHLGPEVCDVELAVPRLAPSDLQALERVVVAVIREARPVTDRWVEPGDPLLERVRTRGLPEGHQGAIRLVAIEGVDWNTCGGTHLRTTAELEALVILGSEPHLGGQRVTFVAGGRVRERMRAHEQRNRTFRTLLGAPDEGLVAALEQKLERLQGLERRGRQLEAALTEALAEALAARSERLVELHLDGYDAAFLGNVARAVSRRDPRKVSFLTGGKEGQVSFVLGANDPERPLDLAALGQEVAALLGGRGGGRAPVFQGKAGDLAQRDRALAHLKARLG